MDINNTFETFMELLYKVTRAIHPYDAVPRKYGTPDLLYMVEAHTIKLIGNNSFIGVTDIANLTGKTKGAVSQMIDKLVEKEIVKKEKDPEDNRRVKISLTEKGKKIYAFHEDLDKTNYQEYLNKMPAITESDINTCNKVLKALCKSAEK